MLDKNSSDQLVARLKVKYPDWDSFDHPQFVEDEIKYKQATAKKAAELLSEEELTSLLSGNAHEEIVRRIDEVGKDNNLLYRGVPMSGDLNILYQEDLDKQAFTESFFDLLYGEGDSVERLERYLQYVDENELPSKWTFPTYFLFFTHPKEEFFVKPRITTRLLRQLELDIPVGQPSAEKYEKIKQFAHDLFENVKDFGPRDMIDIQSLFWVAGQNEVESDKSSATLSKSRLREFSGLFDEFFSEYANTDVGKVHAERYRTAAAEGRKNFAEVMAARKRGDDIVDIVLEKLLPHAPGRAAEGRDVWVHNAPMAASDIKKLLEGKGTANDESWPHIADALVDFFDRCNRDPEALPEACAEFDASGYSKGFQAGTLSPMLNSLQPDEFAIINVKPVQVINYFTESKFKTNIRDYPGVNAAVLNLAETVEDILSEYQLPELPTNQILDMFAHWLVAEKKYHFGKLAEPFSSIFPDRMVAEHALDLLHDALHNLGADASDQRIALTLPKGKNLLRLNFGQWLVMDFRPDSSGNNLCQVALLDKLAREAGLETESTPFADSKDAETVTPYRMPTSRILEEGNLRSIVAKSMTYTGRLFEKWAGTPYRFAHRQDILDAVFDDDKRDTLLSGGAREIRYWKIAPGEGARLWEECLEQGIILLAWSELGDLNNITKDEFDKRLKECLEKYPDWGKGGPAQAWTFAHEIGVGDKIVANRGTTEVIGIGTVTGPYFFRNGEDYAHTISVDWEDTDPKTIDEGGWRRTLVQLDEEKFEKIASITDINPAPPAAAGEFSKRTFELLEGLAANPTAAFYQESKDEIQSFVEAPMKAVLEQAVALLPDTITSILETEKKLFGKILKNDFGRGGAWDYYWGALYPKGGRRIEAPQLFVWVNKDNLGAGFAVGNYASESSGRLIANLESLRKHIEPLFADRWDGIGLTFGDRQTENRQNITLSDWLDRTEQYGVRVALEFVPEHLIGRPIEDLARTVADIFRELFPLMLLATDDEPLRRIREYFDERVVAIQPRYTVADCAQDTSFPDEQLRRWLRAIERKKQAVLYGPPGTGKTYVAEHLAKVIVSATDGLVELVQFHPAYSYEEFIQGIRPRSKADGGLDYPLVAGRFLEFCREASARDGTCVLIIDEINRANLSRVFGELMYLLEYRDHEVKLAAGRPFRIPGNVRIIGTMNTADRSIALVDHALRRRFAFIGLQPNFEVLTSFHAENEFNTDGLIRVLKKVNSEIADPNYELGISFFLRSDLNGQLSDIWQMEIEPYLEEYFFDQPTKVDDLRWEKIKSQIDG